MRKLIYTGLVHTGAGDDADVSSVRVYENTQPVYMKGVYSVHGTVCVKGRSVEFRVDELTADQVFMEMERFRKQVEKPDPIPF